MHNVNEADHWALLIQDGTPDQKPFMTIFPDNNLAEQHKTYNITNMTKVHKTRGASACFRSAPETQTQLTGPINFKEFHDMQHEIDDNEFPHR